MKVCHTQIAHLRLPRRSSFGSSLKHHGGDRRRNLVWDCVFTLTASSNSIISSGKRFFDAGPDCARGCLLSTIPPPPPPSPPPTPPCLYALVPPTHRQPASDTPAPRALKVARAREPQSPVCLLTAGHIPSRSRVSPPPAHIDAWELARFARRLTSGRGF